LVPLFGHPCPKEELTNEEEVGWDCKEICFEGIKADIADLKSEVGGHGVGWHAEGESDKIDGEHVP
jgi:hypothetical protein